MTRKYIILYRPTDSPSVIRATSGQFSDEQEALRIAQAWGKVEEVIAIGEFDNNLYTVLKPTPEKVSTIPWKGE